MASPRSSFFGLKYGSCQRLIRKPSSSRSESIFSGSSKRDLENSKSQRWGTSVQPVSRWMTSEGIRYSRSFFATSLTSSSDEYVSRPIHRPKVQRGGVGARPVRAVYSERISFGEPKKKNRSSTSSPR